MAEFSEMVIEDYLRTPEQRAAFVNEAVAENDPAFLKIALGCVARPENRSGSDVNPLLSSPALAGFFR